MHMQFLRLRYDSVFCDDEFTCLSHGSAMKMAEFMPINYSQEGKIEFEEKEKYKIMLVYRENIYFFCLMWFDSKSAFRFFLFRFVCSITNSMISCQSVPRSNLILFKAFLIRNILIARVIAEPLERRLNSSSQQTSSKTSNITFVILEGINGRE